MLDLSGRIKAGQTSGTITDHIPLDQEAGDYISQTFYISPCPGYRQVKELSVSGAKLTITQTVAQVQYPATAKVELSLTQKQFLDTKTAQFE